MSSLVSIIVPAYNVENFLPKCVESLLSQTYSNLEIIIVDDGSTDKTGDIADQYALNFKNIRCIHKENGGLSDARNIGLIHAHGEYVLFFDSDDWVENNIIEDNLNIMIKYDADVVIWGYYADFVNEKGEVIKTTCNNCKDIMYKKNQNADFLLNENVLGLLGYAWNKMYSRKLLKKSKYTFQKGLSLVEDIVFNTPVLLSAKKIYFNGNPYNHYMQRGIVTLGNRYYKNYLELKLLACDKRKELLIGFGVEEKKSEKFLWRNYFYSYVSTLRMINRQESIEREEKRALVNLVIEKWLASSESRKISTKNLKIILLYLLFRFRLIKVLLMLIK